MASLEDRLKEINLERKQILTKIDRRNSNRSIHCKGCATDHKIGNLTAVQTHWYTPPRGCTRGDYWSPGELQFICPDTGIVNRLLFNNYDVPWKERKVYEHDPEQQFKCMYKRLFREVIDSYEHSVSGNSVNNYYVDQNRKKFGLVEKKK